jgi:trimeric autotransporter adhesin
MKRLLRFLSIAVVALMLPSFLFAQNDLSVGIRVNIDTANIGASRTFTVTVYNKGRTAVTGVHLSTVFTTGFTSVVGTTATGSFAANDWDIGAISAATDSVSLTLTTIASGEGVQTLTAQISAMVESDGDSAPNNNDLREDDMSIACVSIPIYYCDGATINVTATATFAGAGVTYQWYKDGVLQASTTSTFNITEVGSYTYTATGGTIGTCSGSMCCPIIVRYVSKPALTTTPVAICAGSTINLTARVTDANTASYGGLTTTTTNYYLSAANATAQTSALLGDSITASLITGTGTRDYFVRKNVTTNGYTCTQTASFTATVNATVTAGTVTNPPNTCQAGSGITTMDLAARIAGETTGGTWSQQSGTSVGSALNTTTGALNLNGLAIGTYVFRYTVTATSPCLGDTEDVTVIIEACCPTNICLPVSVTVVRL